MNRHSYLRSLSRTSVWLAVLLAAPVWCGFADDQRQAQAQLLDHAEFLCANCFFGASKYYYCFEADNKVIVGYQKTPVLNWEDQSKNYLAPVHPAWAAWNAGGPGVPIRYDDKHIWISRERPARQGFWGHMKGLAFWASRGDDQRVKLTRSNMRDIFSHNDACRAAVAANGH